MPRLCGERRRPPDRQRGGMKFLIDAQLPPGLARWFRTKGHEADHVFEIGLGAASDREIAERAEADNAVLASKDEDFLILRLPDRFALLWMRWEHDEQGTGDLDGSALGPGGGAAGEWRALCRDAIDLLVL